MYTPGGDAPEHFHIVKVARVLAVNLEKHLILQVFLHWELVGLIWLLTRVSILQRRVSAHAHSAVAASALHWVFAQVFLLPVRHANLLIGQRALGHDFDPATADATDAEADVVAVVHDVLLKAERGGAGLGECRGLEFHGGLGLLGCVLGVRVAGPVLAPVAVGAVAIVTEVESVFAHNLNHVLPVRRKHALVVSLRGPLGRQRHEVNGRALAVLGVLAHLMGKLGWADNVNAGTTAANAKVGLRLAQQVGAPRRCLVIIWKRGDPRVCPAVVDQRAGTANQNSSEDERSWLHDGGKGGLSEPCCKRNRRRR
eukprot:m.145972 g.145972  ORF g.145972 m.145972 type:complete len:312 (-) comp17236_c0_seq2:169-1104(-)